MTSSAVNGLYTLNSLEILVEGRKMVLPGAPYSDDLWKTCMSEPYGSEVDFTRHNRQIFVLTSSVSESDLPSPFSSREVTFGNHVKLWPRLIASALSNLHRRESSELFYRRHGGFWEVQRPRSTSTLYGHLKVTPTIKYRPGVYFASEDSGPRLFLTIAPNLRYEFDEGQKSEYGRFNDLSIEWTRGDDGEIYPSRQNWVKYLKHTGQYDNHEEKADLFYRSETKFDYFQEHVNYIMGKRHELHMPKGVSVQTFQMVQLPHKGFEPLRLERPQKYFYNNRTSTSSKLTQVVRELRPYSYDEFASRNVKIAVLCAEKRGGDAINYANTLCDDLTNLFQIGDVTFELTTVPSRKSEFDRFIDNLDVSGYDLVTSVMSEDIKKLAPNESPYYRIKAKSLGQAVPSQDITIETIRDDYFLALNNAALNAYSKLGGTAWVTEASRSKDREFVVGIGASSDRTDGVVVGFANVLSTDGRYILGDCHQTSSKDDYVEHLTKYLTSALRQAFEAEGVREGEKVRLTLHLYKQAGKNREVKAVKTALQAPELRPYDISYALIHISRNHSHLIFKKRGNLPIMNPMFIRLSRSTALVHAGRKKSAPFLLRYRGHSGDETLDLFGFAQQIVNFCDLSHLSFRLPPTPVTVKYPKKVAQQARDLRKVDNWDPASMNRLKGVPWFI